MVGTQKDKLIKLVAVPLLLAVLIGLGCWMILKLLKSKEPALPEQTSEPTISKIVARRELQAFTPLKSDDLAARKGSDDSSGGVSPPTIEEFKDRYLLVAVKRGGEVKRETVAPREATTLLADAVAIGIPATSKTSLGGLIHVGDMVDVLALPAGNNTSPSSQGKNQPTQLMKFENLVVINVNGGNEAKAANKEAGVPVAITLALPRERRDEFASAIAGAELLLTRKIAVTK